MTEFPLDFVGAHASDNNTGEYQKCHRIWAEIMKPDPVSMTQQPQRCISQVWPLIKVLSPGCLKWQLRSWWNVPLSPWLLLFRSSALDDWSYFVFYSKKKRKVKVISKRPSCSRAEESTWIHRRLGMALFCYSWPETTQMGCVRGDKMLGKVKGLPRRGADHGK